MTNSNPTPTQALVAGFDFSLEALELPLLTPGQKSVLHQTLEDALAQHPQSGLVGLLSRAAEKVRGSRRDPGEALKGFVILINKDLDAVKQPRLSKAQGDVFRGMVDGLLDSI